MSKNKISKNIKKALRGVLVKNEKVLMLVKQSRWRLYFPMVLLAVVLIILISTFFVLRSSLTMSLNNSLLFILLSSAIILGFVFWSIVSWKNYRNFILILTNKRVIVCEKAKLSVVMEYEELETVGVKQSLFGKMLGYGTLTFVEKFNTGGVMLSLASLYSSKFVNYIPKAEYLSDKIESIIIFISNKKK